MDQGSRVTPRVVEIYSENFVVINSGGHPVTVNWKEPVTCVSPKLLVFTLISNTCVMTDACADLSLSLRHTQAVFKTPLSLSLSLSLTHTHTHTHTVSRLSHSHSGTSLCLSHTQTQGPGGVALLTQHTLQGAARANRQRGKVCLLYTSPSPRDVHKSRMPSSA